MNWVYIGMFKHIILGIALCFGLTSFYVGCGPISPFMAIPIAVDAYLYWKDGEARKFYTGEAEYVQRQVLASVKFYEHTVESNTKNEDGSFSIVTNSQNHKFKWNISQHDPKVVLVKCRIDFLGDKPYVELLYKKLDEKMGVKTTQIIDESTEERWLRPLRDAR